jgi:hypothetical protein
MPKRLSSHTAERSDMFEGVTETFCMGCFAVGFIPSWRRTALLEEPPPSAPPPSQRRRHRLRYRCHPHQRCAYMIVDYVNDGCGFSSVVMLCLAVAATIAKSLRLCSDLWAWKSVIKCCRTGFYPKINRRMITGQRTALSIVTVEVLFDLS